MKTLNVTFTDEEHKKLQKSKKVLSEKYGTNFSWHKFFLMALTQGVSAKRKGNCNKEIIK